MAAAAGEAPVAVKLPLVGDSLEEAAPGTATAALEAALQAPLPPLYSPTSPASDDEAQKDTEVNNKDTEQALEEAAAAAAASNLVHTPVKGEVQGETERAVAGWVETEAVHPTDEADKETQPKVRTACPELVTGSRLDKAVPLQPGHWIKIGRNPKAHLMCNNAGVSRNQCSIKWDAYEKKVEIRLDNTSGSGGTLVNGKEIKDQHRRYLEHGDRVRIVGKGQTFDFLVDLRPVGLGMGDPRYRARTDKITKSAPLQRRDTLRAQLSHLEKVIKGLETKAFERETEYYEIETRRRLRKQEQTEREEQHQFYLEDAKRLEKHLEESRDAWLAKLDKEHEANNQACAPIIDGTASLQDKLEKLHLKKDEVARSIHPEQYAVANVAIPFELPSDMENASRISGRSKQPSLAGDSMDGEEDAFAGMAGLKDRKVAESSDEEGLAKKRAAAGDDSGEEEVASFLKPGEGEPAAKKARSEDGKSPKSPVAGATSKLLS